MTDESGRATKPCPHCAKAVLVDAKKCKHCKEFIAPSARKAAVKMSDRERKPPINALAFKTPNWQKKALLVSAGVIGAIFALGIASSAYHAFKANDKSPSEAPQASSALGATTPSQPSAQPSVGSSQVTMVQAAPSCDELKRQVKAISRSGRYSSVRTKLLAVGWLPKTHLKSPKMEDGSEDLVTKPIWDAGFKEVDNCAGTEMGQCYYQFTDKYGNELEVVGFSEEADQWVDYKATSVKCRLPVSASGLPIVTTPPNGENVKPIDGRVVWLNPAIIQGITKLDNGTSTMNLVRARIDMYKFLIAPFEPAGPGYFRVSCTQATCGSEAMNIVFNNRTGEVLNACLSPDAKGRRTACAEAGEE